MARALERIDEHGDLFEPVLAGGQSLSRARRALDELARESEDEAG
jgi:hypothetical protein